MPDESERTHGLNPQNAVGNVIASSRYANIEKYANSLVNQSTTQRDGSK